MSYTDKKTFFLNAVRIFMRQTFREGIYSSLS